MIDYNKEKNDLLIAYRDAIKKGKIFNPDKWKMKREKNRIY